MYSMYLLYISDILFNYSEIIWFQYLIRLINLIESSAFAFTWTSPIRKEPRVGMFKYDTQLSWLVPCGKIKVPFPAKLLPLGVKRHTLLITI